MTTLHDSILNQVVSATVLLIAALMSISVIASLV